MHNVNQMYTRSTIKTQVKLFLFFVAIFCCPRLYGQFSVGLEGGANVSTVDFRGVEGIDEGYFHGYFIGIAPRLTKNKITLLLDLNYSYRGHEFGSSDLIEESTKYRTPYWIISPQAEYRLHKSFGIGLGFYMGMEIEEAQKTPFDDEWVNTDEFDIHQSPSYGFNLGVKYFFDKVYIKALFDFGIKNVLSPEVQSINGTTLELYQRSVLLGVGYLFDF
ncbi:MAG: hypothetical protein AAGA77_04485 [Bacteroidota bacterium]